jgi:hypothetical protein
MAEVGMDVGKLRQVLDYWSCETCLDTYSPEQDYLCGVCVRLNREVTVKRAMVGSDEAVQVIPPEDFTMAKDLRDRIQQQEFELEEARAQAQRLQAREQDLERALRKLQEDLVKARKEKDEAGLVPFEFVGVKDNAARKKEEILEFEEDTPEPPAPTEEEVAAAAAATEPRWEAVEAPAEPAFEAVDEEPQFEAVDESATQPQFQAQPQAETIAPGQRARSTTADDAIARIEAEIGKIEKELTELAEKEKEIKKKAKPSRRKR